jgi:hypothetical protein
MIVATGNGAVGLYYDNVAKLSTTSSGINVTGNITSTASTGSGTFNLVDTQNVLNAGNKIAFFAADRSNTDEEMAFIQPRLQSNSGGAGNVQEGYLDLGTTGNKRISIQPNGDISFYDDTGTSENLKWDASADSLNFVDNAKAQFGAGIDLQIYHDGTNSHVRDQGTGDILISASDKLIIRDTTDGAQVAVFDTDGAVSLNYGNSTKFTTTSTGIDVTGRATADGLTSEGTLGNWEIQDNGYIQNFSRAGANYIRANNASGLLRFDTGGTTIRQKIAANGDISFYDDTGTTQALFWDASAERLGLGTTSPDYALDIRDDSNIQLKVSSTTETNNARITYAINNQQKWNHGVQASDTSFTFYDIVNNLSPFKIEQGAATNTLVVDSNSRVGIGTNNPGNTLQVNAPANDGIKISSTTPYLFLNDTDTGASYDGSISQSGTTTNIGGASAAQTLVFRNKVSFGESARFITGGAFLIGKTALGVNTQGLQFNGGLLAVTKDGGEPLILNRKTTDGVVADFRKDNTSVGNTRSFSGDLIIQTGITGLRFNDGNDAIHPVIASGAVSDSATDLGLTNARFKDLHLSGTANVNKVIVGDGTDSGVIAPYNLYLTSGNSNVHIFNKADGSEKARIDGSGNFGIGITSPTSPFSFTCLSCYH